MPQVPPATPPQNPPAIVQEQDQNQQQSQNPTTNITSYDENESRSQSESTSLVNQSPLSSNTQINNTNGDYFGFGIGISRPVPTISGSVYMEPYTNDIGFAVSFSVPIGGRAEKLSTTYIEARNRETRIENSARIASVCNNMAKEGVLINYEMLPEDDELHFCRNFVIAARTPEIQANNAIVIPPPPIIQETSVNNVSQQELELLRRQNEALKKKLQYLYERDQMPINDGE